jgi:hypothetical protein
MIERINTLLLLAILAAIVWVGFNWQWQPKAGRYVPFGNVDQTFQILDTATGKVHAMHVKGDSSAAFHFDLVTGRMDITDLDVEPAIKRREAKNEAAYKACMEKARSEVDKAKCQVSASTPK